MIIVPLSITTFSSTLFTIASSAGTNARAAAFAEQRKESLGLARDMSARDWFLRDSKWDDARWTFAPTNLLEEEQRARILGDFRLPSGRRFTDPEYDSLRETCKRLIASVRARSLSTGLPQRARTAIGHFAHLRPLHALGQVAGRPGGQHLAPHPAAGGL